MNVAMLAIAFILTSPQLEPGARLRADTAWNRDGCGGANRAPELRWAHPPRGTKSFALTMFDPDAGPAGWWHWIVYDLTPARRGVRAPLAPASAGLAQGINDFGTTGYGGPCPPPGKPHHYVFTLYALDVAHLAARAPFHGAQVQARIAGHVLAKATLTGTYRR